MLHLLRLLQSPNLSHLPVEAENSLPCLKPQAGALCYIQRMRFQAKLADLERQFEAKASELRTAYLAEVAEIQAA